MTTESKTALGPELSNQLLAAAEAALQAPGSLKERLHKICVELDANLTHFDWTGFYWVETPGEEALTLLCYVGEPTEHAKIGFGKGVCGQVAASGKTKVVDDVTQEENYISCNIAVKSEIVAPVLKDGKFVGEIDIDSHTPVAFGKAEQELLEAICEKIALHLDS